MQRFRVLNEFENDITLDVTLIHGYVFDATGKEITDHVRLEFYEDNVADYLKTQVGERIDELARRILGNKSEINFVSEDASVVTVRTYCYLTPYSMEKIQIFVDKLSKEYMCNQVIVTTGFLKLNGEPYVDIEFEF